MADQATAGLAQAKGHEGSLQLAQDPTGSPKAWKTRVKFHCGMILGALSHSMPSACYVDGRIGSAQIFQSPVAKTPY